MSMSLISLMREKAEYLETELKNKAPVVCVKRGRHTYIYTKNEQNEPDRIFQTEASAVAFAFYGCFSDIEQVKRLLVEAITEFSGAVHSKDVTGRYLTICISNILIERFEDPNQGVYRAGALVIDLVHGTIYTISYNGDYRIFTGEAYIGTIPGGDITWNVVRNEKDIKTIRKLLHKVCRSIPGVVNELTIQIED